MRMTPSRAAFPCAALVLAGVALNSAACGRSPDARLDRWRAPSTSDVVGIGAADHVRPPSAQPVRHDALQGETTLGPDDASPTFGSRLVRAAASVTPRLTIALRALLVVLGAHADDSTFVTVRRATPDGYDIVFGDANCDGATYCRIGRVTGERISAVMPRPEGKRVTLDRAEQGRFQESVCGANCSDAVLTWDQDGARYTIGIKAGELPDLTRAWRSVVRLR